MAASASVALERVDFRKLQQCSDMRGVAIAVEGEPVTLTEPVTEAIAAAFSAWLLDSKKVEPSKRLRISVGCAGCCLMQSRAGPTRYSVTVAATREHLRGLESRLLRWIPTWFKIHDSSVTSSNVPTPGEHEGYNLRRI